MLNRLARKPSTASLTPAIRKIAKAISIWLEAMAQTMMGTSMMRPSVMIFGILNSVASGYRPDVTKDPACCGGEPVLVYIVYAAIRCEPLHTGAIRRNPTALASGTGHGRAQERADLRRFGRRYRRRQSPGRSHQTDGARHGTSGRERRNRWFRRIVRPEGR